MSEQQEELSAKIAGQEVSIKSPYLSTILILVGVLFSGGSTAGIYFHIEDSKRSNAEFVSAIKEQTEAIKESTVAQRETTCINTYPEAQRERKADFCRRITK